MEDNGVPPNVVTPDNVPVNEGPEVMGVTVKPDGVVVKGITVVPPTVVVVPAVNDELLLLGGLCPVRDVTIVDPMMVVLPLVLLMRLDSVVAGAPDAVTPAEVPAVAAADNDAYVAKEAVAGVAPVLPDVRYEGPA